MNLNEMDGKGGGLASVQSKVLALQAEPPWSSSLGSALPRFSAGCL